MKITKEELNELKSVISNSIDSFKIILSEKEELKMLITLLGYDNVYTILDTHIIDIKVSEVEYLNHKYIEVDIRIFDRSTKIDVYDEVYAIYHDPTQSTVTFAILEYFKLVIDTVKQEARELEELKAKLNEFIK